MNKKIKISEENVQEQIRLIIEDIDPTLVLLSGNDDIDYRQLGEQCEVQATRLIEYVEANNDNASNQLTNAANQLLTVNTIVTDGPVTSEERKNLIKALSTASGHLTGFLNS